MKLNKLNRCYIIIISVFLTVACKREEPTSWDTHMLGPLAYGKISLQQIVTDSLLVADDDGLWHVVFHNDLTDFNLDSLVAIPDTTIRKGFEVPLLGGPFNLPSGVVLINQAEDNLLNVNDVELKKIKLASGTLAYAIKSYINGYLFCDYQLPGVTLDGVGIAIQTTTSPGSDNSPFIQTGSIDLSNHHIDLTGESGFSFNRIYSHLLIKTAIDAPTIAQVSGGDSIVVELEFIDPKVEYASGYFGQHLYELNETVDFAESINFPTGLVNLDGVEMNLRLTNAVGVDAQLEFEELAGTNVSSGNTVPLTFAPIYEPLNITRANESNGEVNSEVYNYYLNNSNSNIDNFIGNLPQQLNLQAHISINPLGNISDGHDFIYTDNALKTELDIDLPLNLGIQDLRFTDTLNIATALDIDASGKLVLYAQNYFPFKVNCDVLIVDNWGNVLETLVENGVLESAAETQIPGVTLPSQSAIAINVSRSVIAHFNPENRLVIKARINTPSLEQPSKIYDNYYMDFRVVADGIVTVKYD